MENRKWVQNSGKKKMENRKNRIPTRFDNFG